MDDSRALLSLIAARASSEGTVEGEYPGMYFYRVSAPAHFRKVAVFGPRLIVVAQGRKRARFSAGELAYDEQHYLVVTGGTHFEGFVEEASPEKPYLAMCMALAPDVVADTLLSLADASGGLSPPSEERLPAFVSRLDAPVTSAVVRLLRSLEDPIERKVVTPLVVEELVFRLLRSEAASVVRGAVREGDAAVREAMRYMRQNANRSLTVEQVARHVGMSGSHFAHRFSAVARVSPMRFLKQARLEAARELMLGRRLRAGEAALAVGYESASHFNRDFKSVFGAAPSQYVRRARGE